jgi:hypothetical protein
MEEGDESDRWTLHVRSTSSHGQHAMCRLSEVREILTLGELISKFREVDVHFESSGAQMTLAAKLKGRPRISLLKSMPR